MVGWGGTSPERESKSAQQSLNTDLLIINLIRNTCKLRRQKYPGYNENPREHLHVNVFRFRIIKNIIIIRDNILFE